MMPEKLQKRRDEEAHEVSYTAASPMLRDMFSMSRGQFKDNLSESYKWGFNSCFRKIQPLIEILESVDECLTELGGCLTCRETVRIALKGLADD